MDVRRVAERSVWRITKETSRNMKKLECISYAVMMRGRMRLSGQVKRVDEGKGLSEVVVVVVYGKVTRDRHASWNAE